MPVPITEAQLLHSLDIRILLKLFNYFRCKYLQNTSHVPDPCETLRKIIKQKQEETRSHGSSYRNKGNYKQTLKIAWCAKRYQVFQEIKTGYKVLRDDL